MTRVRSFWIAAFICLLALPLAASADEAAPQAGELSAAEMEEFFERQVRPVLAEHCFECHGPAKQHADLRLDRADAAFQGNESGPAVVPGKPDESRLIQVVLYPDDDYQMPPKGKLPDEQIAALTTWIEMGAPWPAADDLAADDPEAWRNHWAFQPIARPEPPAVEDPAWPQTPVDQFILAKLVENGLAPSPAADRRTFIRRAAFTLTGLPPTAEEIAAFESDTDPQADAKLVDRLLASPHYGERWGRHWLDLARYADTKGYVFQEDRNYPEAHTYRDWVIRAFNDDMPYDEFLTLQIAADRVAGDDPASLAAMGFLTLGRRFLNNSHDIIDDRIDVVTRGTMAFTVTCARCHDHKYDPIPIDDYYSLYGVFASSNEPKDAPSPLRLVDGNPHDVAVFVRGNPHNRGEVAPRRFLMALSGDDRAPFTDGSGRLELARAIVSPDNPLTARVLVNRVWGHHLGQGLVTTPSDFGLRSDPPSHPELLDWLAGRFIDEGWSIKSLHRVILLSSTYRQRSDHRHDCAQVDPENRLLSRMNRRRLDFEAHRDALLHAAGRLDRTMGGPSVQLTTPPFATRRTVYGFIDRQNLPGLFRTFDFASPDTHSPQRYETTVPQQALFLMNSPFVLEQAERLASRPEVAELSDPAARIRQMYRLAYGRDPEPDELEMGLAFVSSALTGEAVVSDGVWQHGYGEFDESTGRLKGFTRLPHWTGSAWQGGPQLPDPQLGWAMLNAMGGHVGNDQQHAAIRRWTAPRHGTLAISGTLRHRSGEGDGVRGRIVSSRSGPAGEWIVHNGRRRTGVSQLEVQAGDAVDFVTDCRSNPSHDSFEWTVSLRLKPDERGQPSAWNSAPDFRGPASPPLPVWGRYAQVLLLANEFAFVD